MSSPKDDLEKVAQTYRAAGPWLSAAYQFIGASLVGAGVGYFVDSKAGTTPWGVVVGVVLGTVAGFVALVRAASTPSSKSSQSQQSQLEQAKSSQSETKK